MFSFRATLPAVTVGVLAAASATMIPAQAQGGRWHDGVDLQASAAAAVPTDLSEVSQVRSLLGVHTWYQQTSHGYPVVGGQYAVHDYRDRPDTVWDGRVNVSGFTGATASISPATAVEAVTDRAAQRGREVLSSRSTGLWVLPGSGDSATLTYAVHTLSPNGAQVTYVDADSSELLRTDVVSVEARGRGRVLDPNPVAKLQNQSLKDHADANSALPNAAYRVVYLRRLTGNTLVGDWARIINTDRPVRADRQFLYFRHNDKFEMVNAYFAVDSQQMFLRSLGFTDVNAESQKLRTNRVAEDNSWYDPSTDIIDLGRGGVDDAEDVEVTWHEYGHAIQDAQVPNFGTSNQAGAIGEGFGDYIAVTMSQRNAPDTTKTPWACVMDWDSTAYTSTTPHCLRRVDGTKMFPGDMVGEVHADGEIWSRALWDMNNNLGRRVATRIIVEAQFSFTPSTTFAAAANTTVATAQALYGPAEAAVTRQAFVDRGILSPPV